MLLPAVQRRASCLAPVKRAAMRQGMSLVETAVILIVMGIITMIMMPLASNMFLAVSEKKKADQLAALLMHARSTAISQNKEMILEFELIDDPSESDSYTGYLLDRSAEEVKRVTKIEKTHIEIAGIRSAGGEIISKGKLELHFLPSGVAEQTNFYIGESELNPEAIVVLDRYMGTARVIKEEQKLLDYQDQDLQDESWRHDQH